MEASVTSTDQIASATSPVPASRSVLAGFLRPGHHGAGGRIGVTLTERRVALVQMQPRGGQEAALSSALASAFGLLLPGPNKLSLAGELTAVWIQPGSWLVMAPFSGALDLEQRLATALADTASLADQTFGKSVLRLSGERARGVLAKGCRVDLHPRVFGPGCSAVTPIGHIGCVLLQVDEAPSYDLIVPSTLAASFLEWLLTASAEFGCEVEGAD